MRLLLLLSACLLCSCATPQPPVPIAPIPKVDFRPLQNRIESVKKGNEAIGLKLEDTRASLDRAIVEAHNAKLDAAALDRNLQEASKALDEARAEKKAQDDRIVGLQIDKNRAEEDADAARLAGEAARERAQTAEGKVYAFELQQKEDEGNWGLNGVWRWTKHLGWRVIFLVLAIAAITMAVRLFAPAVIPIFTIIWAGVLWAIRSLWRIISKLWIRNPPP